MSIEQVAKEFTANPTVQLEPTPLRRQPPSPDPFPIDALGEVLAPAARAMGSVIQAPVAIYGQSLLAASAQAVQAHANINIDGRISPLSLYFLTIGASGERKTAVDNLALYPHRKHEKTLFEQSQVDHDRHQINHAAWKSARDEALRSKENKNSLDAKRQALEALGPEPEYPLSPYLLVEELTYEGLVKLLATGQPSIGLFSDEGGRMIGGYGMNSENALKTASGLSSLWGGKHVSRVRSGDGSSVLYGRRLSLHLMMQGAVAEQLLGNRLLQEQGILSRCLLSWPDSTAGNRIYKEVDLSQDLAIKRFGTRILEILKEPMPLTKNKRNELDPRPLSLSPQAKKLWINFHDAVEREIHDDGEFLPIRGFASKAAEHAVRIAGVLTLTRDLKAGQVDNEEMAAAIELVNYYLNEALRMHCISTTDPIIANAEKALTWMQSQGIPYISLPDLYQKGPRAIRDAKTARRIVDLLADHDWLYRVDGGKVIDGKHRKDVWRVWR